MILLVCSLLLGGCQDIVTPMTNLFVCTEQQEQMHSCSRTGNPDAVYNTYETQTIGEHTYSIQIRPDGTTGDVLKIQ